jgi:DNA-binding transcriptional MocR family regulator
LADAIAAEKLSFVPGSACYPDQPRRNTLRLSFSLYPEAVIREGVERLARAVSRACG